MPGYLSVSFVNSSRQLLEHLEQGKSAEHIGRCFMDEVMIGCIIYRNDMCNCIAYVSKGREV